MNSKSLKIALLLGALTTSAMTNADAQSCGALPTHMRAARIHAPGGPEALRVESVPVPTPAAGEVLVRVHHASVNPVDWKLQQAGRLPFPATPGGDFAGEIVARGAGVDGYDCGDQVAGIVDQAARGGSYAEYLSVPVSEIVPRPAAFSMAEAAAYPTVAVAAWRYLVVAANVQAGERVLVHGGAGGVGSMVVQIARARGAEVIATASERNHDYLREVGVVQAIDYRSTRFEDVVKEVDIVVDTVGGDTLLRSAAVLRDGGRLVTLVGNVPPELCADGRILCPPRAPWNVRQGLEGVATLIAAGKLKVNIDRSYGLDGIVAAQQYNRDGHTRGKVVIDIGPGVEAAVRVPLQAYLDGHATGLESHFRRAFSDDAILVGTKDGRYGQRSAKDYIAQSASGHAPADEDRRRRWIRSVTVTGKVATAVIELDYPSMRALDHMSLVKFADGWKIVVKAYDAWTPALAGPSASGPSSARRH